MHSLSERIKQARNAKGLNQAELAKAVGVTKSTISQWESGLIKTLAAENLLKLANVLSVPPGWLATGKGPVHPEEPPTQPEFEPTLEASESIQRQIEAGIQRGLTPKDIAESVGVSEQTVSKWQQGRGVNVKNLPKLARVLGISLEQLLTGAPVQGRIPPFAYRHLKEIEEKAARGQLTKRDIEALAQMAELLAEKGKTNP